MVRKLGEACLSFDKRQRPSFTKIARVLGVIETVVRNEGANAGGGASGPGTPGLASGGFAPGSRVAAASAAASMAAAATAAAAMGAINSGPGGVGGGMGSATSRLSGVIGVYGPASASVGPSGMGSAGVHGSPLGPGVPPGAYDGLLSLGPNGAGGSNGYGSAMGSGALFGGSAALAAGQSGAWGAAANGSASPGWALMQGRSSVPGHPAGPWTSGAGGTHAYPHHPPTLITSPSCSSLQGVPSESSLGAPTPSFARVGSLHGHAHVSVAGAGAAVGPRAQGPLSAQPRSHRRSSGYGGSMPSMPVLAEVAHETATPAAPPPALPRSSSLAPPSAALVALALANASAVGSNDSSREFLSGTAAAVATAAAPPPLPLAAIGRASTMPRASAPRVSAYGGVEFPVQQSAGPLSGRTLVSCRASAPTVPLSGPAQSPAAVSYSSGGGTRASGSSSALRPSGVYEMLGTNMHTNSPSNDASPFRSPAGVAPSPLRPSPPRPPLPQQQQQQQQRANDGHVSSAGSPFLVAGPSSVPHWREAVPNPRFVMRPPETADHLRIIQGALLQALPEYALGYDVGSAQDAPAVAAAHVLYQAPGHVLPGGVGVPGVGMLGAVAGVYGASAPPPPMLHMQLEQQQQQQQLFPGRSRPMLHTLAGQWQQQCPQSAPMAAAAGGGAVGPEVHRGGTGADAEGMPPAVAAAHGAAGGGRQSSIVGVERMASFTAAAQSTAVGSPARRVSFQPVGVQQQQLSLQMQQQQLQQQQQHFQQCVLDPVWPRYTASGVAASPAFQPPAAVDTTAFCLKGNPPLFQSASGLNYSHPGPGAAIYVNPAAAAAAAAAAGAGAGRCPSPATAGAGPVSIPVDWCADRHRPMGHVGSHSPDPTRHVSHPRLVSLGVCTAGSTYPGMSAVQQQTTPEAGTWPGMPTVQQQAAREAGTYSGMSAVQQQVGAGAWAGGSAGARTDRGGGLDGAGDTGISAGGAADSVLLDDSMCASGMSILFQRQTQPSSSSFAADPLGHAAGSLGAFSVQHGTAMGQLLALAHLPDGLFNGTPPGANPSSAGSVSAGHVAQAPGLVSGYQLMYGMGIGVAMGGQMQGNPHGMGVGMGAGVGSGASPPPQPPQQPQAGSLGCLNVGRDGPCASGVQQGTCQPGSPLSYRERERDRAPAGLRRDTILEGDEDAEGA